MKSFLSFVLLFHLITYSQSWYAVGTGTNGSVNAFAILNNELYIGGAFTQINGVSANRIAKWNGTNWSAIGNGFNDTVFSLAVYNGALIAGGKFTMSGVSTINKIAIWNNNTWNNMALGMNDDVYSLIVFSGDLRAAGKFTSAGGTLVNRIARWNGTSWFSMGILSPGANDIIQTMALYNNELVIGGKFTIAGGNANCKRIARWNGSQWLPLSNGIDNGEVNALESYAGSLIVGGNFNSVSGITVNNLIKWNSTNWEYFGTGTNNIINDISLSSQNILYIGGTFTSINGVNANRIAMYNGSTFQSMGNGVNGTNAKINKIEEYKNGIFAGGVFSSAGTTNADNLALWGSNPEAPVLISPLNTSTGQSLTPILDWNYSNFAFSYQLQLSTSPSFSTFIINQSEIIPTEYSIQAGLLQNGVTYYWRVRAFNSIGYSEYSPIWNFTTGLVGINLISNEIPKKFKLYQNYPNPFNPVTKIRYDIPEHIMGKEVKLLIFDINGKILKIINKTFQPGMYEYNFDAENINSGVYFYRITTEIYTETKKMIILR